MDIEDIYNHPKSLPNECEYNRQIDDAIYSDKIKEEIKEETSSTTNIIVTKYANSTADMLDVEPNLGLDNKGKIIEVELLHSDINSKSNFATIINGTVLRKNIKSKSDNNENMKYLHGVKKKKSKQCSSFCKEFFKANSVTLKRDFSESQSDEIVPCSECNKQFASRALLKKHLSTCKVHSLSAALCSKCGKNFSSNYNLKRHMTSCKLCPENEKSPRYMCQCGRTYSQEWDMKKHKLKCKDGKKKCKHCLVSNCNLLFYHKAQLIAHMKKDHNMIIQDPKIFNFNSFDEFLLWKEKEEEETFTYYSKQTGSNVSGVSVNTYYVCQHDGSDRTHTSAPRKTERRNKKGRIKTGRLCWSQMNVKQFKDGTVKVTYFPSHTHPVSIADTEHHPLPSSITMEIKRRFSEISKLNESEEIQSGESQELKKGKRKRYGMSLRTLRALARKNRSLFRITAEAMQKTDGSKDHFEPRGSTQYSGKSLIQTSQSVQTLVQGSVDEQLDDPDPIQVFDVSNMNESTPTNESLLEDCISYLNDLKTHILSGKLSETFVIQIKESLKNMCDLLISDIQENSTVSDKTETSDTQEVMMFRPQSPLPVTEIFPLQDEINTQMEINENIKPSLENPDQTVYQIIAVDGEEKSSNEYVYQNDTDMIGPREFIIIAADPAQLFQSVDSNMQFDLN